MGLFDLEGNFAFYGAYHRHPVNIVLHIIFVWPIPFAALVLLYFTPPLFPIQLWDQSFLIFNYGFLLTVIYALYYVSLDKNAGALAALIIFSCWVGSSALAPRLGFSLAWKVVLASQSLCILGQFTGHSVFEKRVPSLLDNLCQALLMAPFFILLAGLQSAFCYEPYPGFNARIKGKIDAEMKDWDDKKQKKNS